MREKPDVHPKCCWHCDGRYHHPDQPYICEPCWRQQKRGDGAS